jgi:peptidoglycan/xylan/chitin deacetylase (PgdA/CDA1 family)
MHRLDVLSSVNSRDDDRTDTEGIVSTVMDQIQPGAVVGMHDGGGPHAQTIAAVEQLIPALRAKGYRFVTVDELLAFEGR